MDSMLPLYQAFDALFPVGAYALSGGLETYTQKGLVHDRASLMDFLRAQLYILPYGDLGLAALLSKGEDFAKLDDLCAAMKQPLEIRVGSEKLCARFLKVMERLADYKNLAAYSKAIKKGECDGHYPIAIGLLIRDLDAPPEKALELYCYNVLSVTVNHAVKLVPLGQIDGQSALAEAMKSIPGAVAKSLSISVDELGVSGCGLDLRAIQHETLWGRLYSS